MEYTAREFFSWLRLGKDIPAQPVKGVSTRLYEAGQGQDGLKRVVRVDVSGASVFDIRNVVLTPEGNPMASDCGLQAKILFNAVNKPPTVVVTGAYCADNSAYRPLSQGDQDGGVLEGRIFDTRELTPEEGLTDARIRTLCAMFSQACEKQEAIGTPANPLDVDRAPPAPSSFVQGGRTAYVARPSPRICRG